jgi:hypothetical protein
MLLNYLKIDNNFLCNFPFLTSNFFLTIIKKGPLYLILQLYAQLVAVLVPFIPELLRLTIALKFCWSAWNYTINCLFVIIKKIGLHKSKIYYFSQGWRELVL